MITASPFYFLLQSYLFILIAWAPEIARVNEICDNGIDDDNNGLTDLNDPQCDCEIVDFESMIPNPSFEAYTCCPSDQAQMDCVTDWSQASGGTTDYINECGYISAHFNPPPFPLPDGVACLRIINGFTEVGPEAIVKIYKEYAGVCLNYPMQKDSVYLLELYVGFINESISPDFNLSFFGTSDCANLPFVEGSEYDCPSSYPGWSFLQSKLIESDVGAGWKKVSIEIIPPQDMAAIAIGPDCELVEELESFYYFFDNLVLDKAASFDFKLLPSVSTCSPDFRFAVNNDPDFAYQWYKEGIALVGETASQLSSMYGDGRYQLRIIDDTGCRISEDYIYSIAHTDILTQTICRGEEFQFGGNWLTMPGTYADTFASLGNCDSIVILDLQVEDHAIDSFAVQILEGTAFAINGASYDTEGDYLIDFRTSHGCDSLRVLQLSVLNFYLPNAFSPNGDGINDVFKVFFPREENSIAKISMTIYDRWGGIIFIGEEWDGRTGNESINPGVFVFTVEFSTVTGERLFHFGELTLFN